MMKFIAFDVETATGARTSLCQIGFVKVKKDSVVESKSFYVKPPGNEYSARNSCLHGISALDTMNMPIFPEIWDQIKKQFKSNLLIAHNAGFDVNVLSETLKYYKLKVPDFKYKCTYQMTGLKLSSLCQALNIDLEKHHDALADAKACAEAYIKLKKGIELDLSVVTEEVEVKDTFAGHEKISGDLLKPDLDVQDKENPFYNKKIVITGVPEIITRKEAAEILKAKGADIDTTVTKRTKYVFAGKGAGPSKLKKIDEFNSQGAKIEILDEATFLKMIDYHS
jgi:DNA polymerase-3 subunit epsilon